MTKAILLCPLRQILATQTRVVCARLLAQCEKISLRFQLGDGDLMVINRCGVSDVSRIPFAISAEGQRARGRFY